MQKRGKENLGDNWRIYSDRIIFKIKQIFNDQILSPTPSVPFCSSYILNMAFQNVLPISKLSINIFCFYPKIHQTYHHLPHFIPFNFSHLPASTHISPLIPIFKLSKPDPTHFHSVKNPSFSFCPSPLLSIFIFFLFVLSFSIFDSGF